MKTYTQFSEAASEEQVRAQNPNASPEMVRRASEKSKRSESQRNANEAARQAAPAGSIQKRTTSSIVKPQSKSGALAKRPSQGITKAKSSELANQGIKKVDVKVDKPRFQARRPGTTRTTTTTTETKPPESEQDNSEQDKDKTRCPEDKIKVGKICVPKPKLNRAETDDSVSTGSVQGLNFKNQD